MNMLSMLLALLLVIFGIAVPETESVNVEAAAPPTQSIKTYGPGHENHQFAAWDNGDGTHSVACDCGIEKRIEQHHDLDADSLCDTCGLVIE